MPVYEMLHRTQHIAHKRLHTAHRKPHMALLRRAAICHGMSYPLAHITSPLEDDSAELTFAPSL
jgi:hypothetical protein